MQIFDIIALTPPGLPDPAIAIAASRAGGIGILDLEYTTDAHLAVHSITKLATYAKGACGIKLNAHDESFIAAVSSRLPEGLRTVVLTFCKPDKLKKLVNDFRLRNLTVFLEVTSLEQAKLGQKCAVDGLLAKGNEAAGFVGEKTSFILLQQIRSQILLPLWIQGGIGLHTAAACYAAGAAGIVLDSQLNLTQESPLPEEVKKRIKRMDGSESVCVGDGVDIVCRMYNRPGTSALAELQSIAGVAKKESGNKSADTFSLWHKTVQKHVAWDETGSSVWLLGQDAAFAASFAKKGSTVASIFSVIRKSINEHIKAAQANEIFCEGSCLAKFHGTPLPLVQGPMARISDNASFAEQVAAEGALPFIALSVMKPEEISKILGEVKERLGSRPWGIGILGFNERGFLDSQIKAAVPFAPGFAIIAGGLPHQVPYLEAQGIRAYVHVPSPALLDMFIDQGVRNFIFEGNECGGHIGPRTSFVLWETMIEKLLEKFRSGQIPDEFHILFAGGIHDGLSASMVASMASLLSEKGTGVGAVMGTAYLFTNEILKMEAIAKRYQKNALTCAETRVLEMSPGHALRCCDTPFVKNFTDLKIQMKEKNLPTQEASHVLEKLILGRARIASKGTKKNPAYGSSPAEPYLISAPDRKQHEEGLYMIGQLAALQQKKTLDIKELHHRVTYGCSERLRNLQLPGDAVRAPRGKSVDIAIIGIAGLLPKANDMQTFWENILNKVNAIAEIPSHRWDWRLYYNEDRQAKDKIYSKWGGFIDDLAFDPARFGIPPKSIQSVDPMQLMALEVAWRTLVDAGYEEKDFDRERASVIIGASGGAGDVGMQYGLRAELPRFQGSLPDSVAQRLPEWTEDTFAGILLNVMAGRIANRLNLGGLNFTTDAACASSLAAIYQGVSELSAGRSDMVIAGGVDTVQGPFGYLCFSKTQALSPRGRCCTFDDSTDGIVISEGIAMVVLKRLEEAERDGDRIYAVVKGIGGSSDGKAKGLTAPLPEGQLRAMRRAYDQAGFGPDSVELFEAHGTGTVAGDTAELESTTALLKEAGGKTHQAVIGSVKTMIGHTKATAGVVGLIKAAFALHHGVLPPHFGVEHPNKVLQQINSPLYLVNEAMPWLKTKDHPRRAASSAFGFGGTNFHVVLEEYRGEYRQSFRPAVSQHWPAELLLLSGIDRQDLVGQMKHYKRELKKMPNIELRDLAYNLAKVFRTHGETLAIIAVDSGDLVNKIGVALNYLSGESAMLSPGIYHGDPAGCNGKLAVLFSGQGSQYTGMFREAALHFPIIAETLSEADDLLNECFASRFGAGMQLSHFIFPRGCYSEQDKADATRALTSTDVAQPALGAVEAGLWKLMLSLGLEPDMLGGHSYGEFAAFFAGDVIGFDALMSLSEARGRFIVDAVKNAGSELGAMAAIHASRADVEKAISDIDDVVVANHNGPQQSVISGSKSAIKEVLAKMSDNGVIARQIPVAAAFHSRFVKPAQSALAELIGKTAWQRGKIPVYSNTTGEPHTKNIRKMKQIMSDHMVKPVEFLTQVESMYRDGARVFIELGPKAVLTKLIGSILEGRPHKAVAIDGNGSGITGMLHAFGQLLCAGVTLDVLKLFEGRSCLNGDPSNLSMLQRHEQVPEHAWMLNGSRARRVTDPIQQVGVLMDEPGSLANGVPQQEAPFESNVSDTTKSKYRKEETRMKGREQDADESEVMAEYFSMMRQFLETQERIMSMYIGGGAANVRRTGQLPSRHVQFQKFHENLRTENSLSVRKTKFSLKTGTPPGAATENSGEVEAPLAVDVHKEPSTASAQPENVSAGVQAANRPIERIDREKMTSLLLGIIDEKTGYPPDMVGLTQNLEADLGIDSIKRVEIIGALMKALPPSYGQALDKDLGGLNTQPTLKDMLDVLDKIKTEGVIAVPFDQAEMGSATLITSHSFRHVIKPKQEIIEKFAMKHLYRGHFIITRDKLGVAEHLSALLRARDCTVSIPDSEILNNEGSLNEWCRSLASEIDAIAGIVHLAQIGSDWLPAGSPVHVWRSQLQRNEKSLFMILHNLSDKLKDDAHVLSASALGGFFNRDHNVLSGLSLQSGALGLLKSLREECPHLRTKAVDIDSGQRPDSIAQCLLDELELAGGRQEVGYPGGMRTIFQTISETLSHEEGNRDAIRNLVILATGGGKGVTAELLRELALPGNTLLLTGRSALHEEEPEEVRRLRTLSDLRQHFISEVRNGRLQLTPAEIQRRVQSILSSRELRQNINDFRESGATVEYFSVDVTNDEAMGNLLQEIYKKYSDIGGVVHGAGIIDDKLLADKTGESWSRVVETKVLGLLLLQKHLRPESLRFLTVLSSVAGRYGNSGQTDYATANELMNRLCCQLSRKWGNAVNVKALCWGPWGPAKYGAGMVTDETEAKFAGMGVKLVNAEAGRGLFRDELTHAGESNIEVVGGEGPWEEHEAELGRIERDDESEYGNIRWPLLDKAKVTSLDKGDAAVSLCLDENHIYLNEHRIDRVPVLPAAAALEIMSEAACHLWPGWRIIEARDCRMLKGVEFKEQNHALNVVVSQPKYGSNGDFEIDVSIESGHDNGKQRFHYRSVLRLAKKFPERFKDDSKSYSEKNLTVEKAYNEWLFHGPRFQVIEEIAGMSEDGAQAYLKTTSPADWLLNIEPGHKSWVFDPAVVDAAAQMALLWGRAFWGESALPAKFGRVVRYSETMPERLSMHFVRLRSDEPHLIRANVFFSDADRNVVLLIEDMECVSSAELNRLGGSAGKIAKASI